nr:hypothetical protein [uncultured Dyadobacter sp.]
MKTAFNLKYLPLFALVLGGSLAVASSVNGSKTTLLADYDVELETSTYYQVGTPPSCGTGSDQACKISSPQGPGVDGRISKSVSGIEVKDTRAN